jgi:hypothetical protein|tara:strand:- start:1678 stop:1917 length:240 start_codon:yes stop_codon:yes gene_type:complete
MDQQSKVERMAASLSTAGIEGCIRACEGRIAAIDQLDADLPPPADLAAAEARAQGRAINLALLAKARAALAIRVAAGGS